MTLIAALAFSLAACGSRGAGSLNIFGGGSDAERAVRAQQRAAADEERSAFDNPNYRLEGPAAGQELRRRETLWDLFSGGSDAELNTNVNRYLWQASLDVLNFLPIETVDPFSGVISTGFGRPPGGGRAYRATVYISDPSLDARSLRLAMQQQGGGAVSAQVVRQIEDAILTRARELRVRDSRI
jgi:hypothetical protein